MLKTIFLLLGMLIGSASFADVINEGQAPISIFFSEQVRDTYWLDGNTGLSVIVKPFVSSNDKTVRLAIGKKDDSPTFTIINTNFKMNHLQNISKYGRCIALFRYEKNSSGMESMNYIFSEVDFDKKEISLYMYDEKVEMKSNPSVQNIADKFCETPANTLSPRSLGFRIHEALPNLKPFYTIKY